MAVAAVAAVVIAVTPASAAGSTFLIVNQGSGNGCLDLTSYDYGTAVLARCDGNVRSQYWYLTNIGQIANGGGNNVCLSLESASYENGTKAIVTPCDGRQSQIWDIERTGTIRNVHSINGCIQFAGYTNRTPATLTRCALGDNHQQWRLS
ncbi:RICIN domain-containing protein [Kribbella sp. NBC_01505]|uniref:ricin-type beta-trefoil lectin domain protein n=1 Tax=Kribbella sp. NBC_01505 TaxID=2903580 RepID=UPI0038696474